MASRKKPRSAMGRSPARAKKERNALGRLESALTPALLELLAKTHEDGDFRNVTAARCGVHPKMLSRWLKQGQENEGGLYAKLFIEFTRIEGEIRAESIQEVRDPEASFEETTYDDGKPVGKTTTSRRTSGVQWYMERRFRQWRGDWTPKEDEGDAIDLLTVAQGALTLEAAIAIAGALAKNMPPPLRAIFAAEGWHQLTETPHA